MRKTLLMIVLIFGLCVVPGISAWADNNDGLVGYWKFDEGSGTTVADASGNGNAGLLLDDVSGKTWADPRWADGKFGKALLFPDDAAVSGAYLRMTKPFGAPQWTVSFWINPQVPISAANHFWGSLVLMHGDILDHLPGYDPAKKLDSALMLLTNGIGYYTALLAAYDFNSNPGWHYVVVTYDGKTLKAGVDNLSWGQIETGNPLAASVLRTIGGYPWFDHHYIGLMDEVRFYNRVLSDREIALSYDPALASDVQPPVVTPTYPSGELSARTTFSHISVATNEEAMCRYALSPGTAYQDMTGTMGRDASLKNFYVYQGLLESGQVTTYYVRCRDKAANDDGSDTLVTLKVAADASTLVNVNEPVIQEQRVDLAYAPAPVDNPLKGFLAFQGQADNFPHSVEFTYIPLRSLMTGPSTFVWDVLEKQLAAQAKAGRQMVVRVYLDYPKSPVGIPQFLLDEGVLTRSYTAFNNTTSVAPDYEDPRLRKALKDFIAAFGQRYDGDPRIGYIQLGLLGFWGEWHMWGSSISQYFASPTVRAEVMDAYQQAFTQTKLLARYPADENKDRPFGYHDDSFAYQTLPPPLGNTMGAMAMAGTAVMNKWKMYPFGGEVRPEIQGQGNNCMWDVPSCVPVGQEYDTCVDQTHASWMLNAGAFDTTLTGEPRGRALAGAARLGYALQVVSASVGLQGASVRAAVHIKNLGVAPFYYNWVIELAAVSHTGQILRTWATPWRLSTIMPGDDPKEWVLNVTDAPQEDFTLVMHVVNPLAGGKALRFANVTQDQTLKGWLTLMPVAASALLPRTGDVSGDGRVTMYDAALVLKYAVGGPLTTMQQAQADINGDTKVDVVDAVAVAKKALGMN